MNGLGKVGRGGGVGGGGREVAADGPLHKLKHFHKGQAERESACLYAVKP